MANELKLANPIVVGSLATDPGIGYNGEIYYNTTTNMFRIYQNGLWQNITSGAGTVSSVGLADGSSTPIYAITNSPVTGTGTLTFTLENQNANKVFAGPATGGPSQPTFRTLVAADIPAISLTAGVSGILPIANGGTGQASAASAFAALSPLTTAGDLLYENASPTPARLPIGTNGEILTVVSGLPAWATAPATGANTSLSNLIVTSINQPLLPNANETLDLGSSLLQWNELWVKSVVSSDSELLLSGNASGISVNSNQIHDLAAGTAGTDAVNLTQLELYVPLTDIGAPNGVASLDGTGKIPVAQLPSSVMLFLGLWDPSTNTPTLVDGTGTNGDTYYVSTAFPGPVAGLDDPSMYNFQIGDLVIYNGTVWQLVSPANGVQSVNGAQGVVIVNAINQLTGDVTAGPASGSQSKVATISAGAVTTSKLGVVTDGITTDQSGPGSTIEVKAGGITNTQVSATAAIALSKLAPLNDNRSLFSSATGVITDINLNTPNMVVNNLLFGPTTTDFIEEQYVPSITLTAGNMNVAVDASTTFLYGTYAGFQAEYYATDGTDSRMGKLSLVVNPSGGNQSLTDTFNDTADIGIVFTAVNAGGGSMELRYSNSNASDVMMRIRIHRFLV